MQNPMIATNPEGRKLAPAPVEFPEHLPPSDEIAEPVEPVAETTATPSAASEPDPSPQDRLNAARAVESDLIGRTTALKNSQRAARSAVAEGVRALQEADPNRQSADDVARDFIRTSNATRAERVARQGGGPPRIAYVDAARKYATGGDGSDFARRQNISGNKRGGFSRAEAAARGFINRDPARGGTPTPVETRPAIPALARK